VLNLKMQHESRSHGFFDLVAKFFDTLIRLRYVFALIAFILLVLFKINGSNIGFWSNYIDESGKNTVVSGEARGIRSDEWEVLMPIYLSQQNSDTPFTTINPDITPSGHNVVITLGAPVKDVYTVSKPLQWGFLFLSADYALSWYWDLKFILILLLSFELCMIISKQNKLISVLGSLWIVLSPAVQWWFAQHVGDNVLYFEAIVVTFYYFLKYFDKTSLKIIFGFLFSLSCVGFIIPLYPPIQITFGFLALILMILIFIDFRKQIRIKKTDVVIIGVLVIFTIAMLGNLYLIIKDAVYPMTHTVYPGQRISAGGDGGSMAFYSYLTNFWLPYNQVGIVNENACELASFFNFLPAVLLAFPVIVHIYRRSRAMRERKMLKYGVALAVFSTFFAIYESVSFVPQIVAKFTLLSYVTGSRAMIAYAFSAVLLSVWALSELSKTKGVNWIYALLASGFIAVTYFCAVEFTGMKGDIRLRYYLEFILVLTVLNYLLLKGKKWMFSAIMVCVVFYSGYSINPVNIGAGAILDNQISEEIRAVDKSNQGANWMAVDQNLNAMAVTGTLIYANGAKSVGGINNYPDNAKWSVLDPQKAYGDIYNRSAHVSYQIVKTETEFDLLAGNAFLVNINVNDLKKLDIDYVLSDKQLTQFNNGSVSFKALYAPDKKHYTIYKVSYS
jgi:hypothetical protein